MPDVVREVSPLAPGRYWLDLTGEASDDFTEWVRDMAGAVRVESTEEDVQSEPPSLFVIIVVPEGREPFLPAERLGFPHTAPPNIKFRRDVTQRPDEPLDLTERLQAALSNMQPMGWVVVLGGLYLLLSSSGGGKRR